MQFNPRRFIWEKITKDLALRGKDDQPLWLVHPIHKRKVDVVALPLEPPNAEIDYCPINRLPHESELLVAVSMDVYVLGYPFGASPPGFPIWKRGSIAFEPEPLAEITVSNNGLS